MTWYERCARLFIGPWPLTVVNASPETAYGLVFRELSLTQPRVLHIDLEPKASSTWIANRLVDEMLQAGISVVGRGMPFSYVIDRLAGLSSRSSPSLVLIGNAEQSIEFCNAIDHTCRTEAGAIRAVLAGFGRPEWHAFLESTSASAVVSGKDLLLTAAEARDWIFSNGYSELTSQVPDHPVSFETLARTVADSSNDLDLFQELRQYNASHRNVRHTTFYAFSVAQSAARPYSNENRGPPLVDECELLLRPEEMDELGDALLARGEANALLHCVEAHLQKRPNDGCAMYWWFQAQVALGQHRDASGAVRRYLKSHQDEGPELLAAYASCLRPTGALEMAALAVEMKRCPETLASEGFLRSIAGETTQGIGLLREAFDGYRSRGHMHRATQVANSIGSAYIQIGKYTLGYYWAQRSWGELSSRSMPEELLRLSTLNLLTYSQLLLGITDDGHELLDRLCLLTSENLPPTLEGIVTTVGDFALVRNDFETALAHYKKAYDEFSSSLPGYATLPYVRCLLRMNKVQEAEAVVGVANALASPGQVRELTLIRVAQLLVALAKHENIEEEANSILASRVTKGDAQLATETVLALATCYLKQDRPAHAMLALEAHQAPLYELGTTGWRLFSPDPSWYEALRQLTSGPPSTHCDVRLLGTRNITHDGTTSTLPLRSAELAALLAFNPTGLRGQELLVELIGERGKLGTLKARISRARRHLPIEGNPYRLGDSCTTDATRLEELLQVGQIREAVALYGGPLLSESDSPGIQRLRIRLEEALRQAVLHSHDPDLIVALAKRIPDDLELWEAAMLHLPADDPNRPLVQAHVRTIRIDWGID